MRFRALRRLTKMPPDARKRPGRPSPTSSAAAAPQRLLGEARDAFLAASDRRWRFRERLRQTHSTQRPTGNAGPPSTVRPNHSACIRLLGSQTAARSVNRHRALGPALSLAPGAPNLHRRADLASTPPARRTAAQATPFDAKGGRRTTQPRTPASAAAFSAAGSSRYRPDCSRSPAHIPSGSSGVSTTGPCLVSTRTKPVRRVAYIRKLPSAALRNRP